jgi:hypothetical protein
MSPYQSGSEVSQARRRMIEAEQRMRLLLAKRLGVRDLATVQAR